MINQRDEDEDEDEEEEEKWRMENENERWRDVKLFCIQLWVLLWLVKKVAAQHNAIQHNIT